MTLTNDASQPRNANGPKIASCIIHFTTTIICSTKFILGRPYPTDLESNLKLVELIQVESADFDARFCRKFIKGGGMT